MYVIHRLLIVLIVWMETVILVIMDIIQMALEAVLYNNFALLNAQNAEQKMTSMTVLNAPLTF